ncbi:MAG: phage portal protein [Rhodobiaceae bacterium]|nr:phage portal protein [Rhodobiaceae bacterium]
MPDLTQRAVARPRGTFARLFRRDAALPAETKSALAPLLALSGLAGPEWTARSYAALAREGFQRNPVVYRSVRMISEAAASVVWQVKSDGEPVDEHPVLALLGSPNGCQSGAEFFETVYGHLLVSGNAYLRAGVHDGAVRELMALRPDRVRVIADETGWPEAYEYAVDGRKTLFPVEPPGVLSPILHLKLFHPSDDHYGMSPLEAAQVSLDIHNASGAWNKALLDNAARPSGALVYAAERGNLTEEQFARLKAELEENFSGAANAGRPLLLEGGLDWKSMGYSPRDLDFVDTKDAASREIALAFGVPPMLLGIPGDATYANYKEANRAFWRQTVLPLVRKTASALSGWLSPAFPDRVTLDYDANTVEALAPEREALWRRIMSADVLTANEKRKAVGFPALDEEKDG